MFVIEWSAPHTGQDRFVEFGPETPGRAGRPVRPMVRLVPAREEDMERVFVWANDPEVREASFDTSPIAWSTHVAWFRRRLSDPDTRFNMIRSEDRTLVGCVRMQISNGSATVSIMLDPLCRGRRLGQAAIFAATMELFQNTLVRAACAWIKAENIRSLRVFGAAGYAFQRSVTVSGVDARIMVAQRRIWLPMEEHTGLSYVCSPVEGMVCGDDVAVSTSRDGTGPKHSPRDFDRSVTVSRTPEPESRGIDPGSNQPLEVPEPPRLLAGPLSWSDGWTRVPANQEGPAPRPLGPVQGQRQSARVCAARGRLAVTTGRLGKPSRKPSHVRS